MSKRFYRIMTAAAASLLAACAGTVGGYVIGLAIAFNGAQHALEVSAASHSISSDRFPTDAISVLAKMNALPYPRCSEAELASFRRLILASHYIKEAGLMSGSKLQCSATFNFAELPHANDYWPAFTERDGTLIYTYIDALRMDQLTPIVLRKGDAYVALDPYNRDEAPTKVRYALTRIDVPVSQSNHLGDSMPPLSGDVLTRNTSGRAGGTLYATRCSPTYPTCLTGFIPILDVLRQVRRQVGLSMIAGCLIGICFGLVCWSLYQRNKGIEHQLRRAIRRDALRVFYQPLVDLNSRQVVGAEALVRWTDDDDLVIPPDIFIKIAEERAFVNLITRLVVRHVLQDFGRYLAEHPEFRINVNVVAPDLTDPAFQPMLEASLARARILPTSLGIEITEGTTARQREAIQAIARLRQQGHKVYVDDFGTGYSSLAYLNDLCVDGIKIDKAFTHAIGTEAVTVGILPQILAMAESLKLEVVAEGIETEGQATYYTNTAKPLRAQGWLFGRPVPPEEFQQRWLDPSGKGAAPPDAAGNPFPQIIKRGLQSPTLSS